MRYIKKFESIANRPPYFDEMFNQNEPGKTTPFVILSKLMNGFAIEVDSKNVEKFLYMMGKYTEDFFIPKYTSEYSKGIRYFLMIGDRLMHTETPTFGAYDLNIYKPIF